MKSEYGAMMFVWVWAMLVIVSAAIGQFSAATFFLVFGGGVLMAIRYLGHF